MKNTTDKRVCGGWVMFVRAKSLKMSTFEVVLKNDKGTSTVLLAAGTDSIVI